VSEDSKKLEPKPVPPGQGILPAFKKYIAPLKKDWRPWRNGRGEQIDSPPYRGVQFTGKIVPPLTDSAGNPIKDGPFQIVLDARGNYCIVDWSLPIDPSSVRGEDDDDLFTAPLMGRRVYQTKHSLVRAKAAMAILAEEKRERARGLLPDPAQCFDLKGTAIMAGKLALRQFQRGPHKSRYVIVNDALDITLPKRGLVIKERSLKDAVARFVKEAQLLKANFKPKKRFVAVGAPIAFSAPEGFGGFGGAFQERTCPTPDSKSWDVTVDLYARTGAWCKTARLIWAGEYPQELVEQCENYRQEYLANPSAFYDPAPLEADAEEREKAEGHVSVRGVLECFEGSYVATSGTPEELVDDS
jgi:hypothetical protein